MKGLLRGLVLWAVLVPGCITHLDKNAPGHAPLTEPPRDITYVGVETPEDPGEYLLLVGFRPAGMVGGLWGSGEAQSTFRLSAQLVAGLMALEKSHKNEDVLRLLTMPSGYFAALGWDVLTLDDFDAGTPRLGAFYAQGFYRWDALAGHLGAGYAYNPFSGAHGPIITASFVYINYIRIGYLIGEGFHLGWGLSFEIPHGWAWSR